MDSLVSVVVPCYNDRDNLTRAIRSVLGQRFLHEIVIVDDHSTDDSLAVAEGLCDLDARIAVFATPRNLGPAGARNFGARFATGHYLAFLDSDDEYLPAFLTMTVDALEQTPGMRAIKTAIEFLGPDGTRLLETEDPRAEALTFSIANNVVMTREAFEDLGGFPEDERFRGEHAGEDVAFNEALAKFLVPLGRLYEVGYRYWNKPGSHLDRFLANTRRVNDTFEFIQLGEAQQPGGPLEQAIDAYLERIAKHLPTPPSV